MKKRLLFTVFAFMLFAGAFTFSVARIVNAGCGCAMVCADRCQVNCDNCGGILECLAKANECYDGAKEATGPLPACPPGGVGGS